MISVGRSSYAWFDTKEWIINISKFTHRFSFVTMASILSHLLQSCWTRWWAIQSGCQAPSITSSTMPSNGHESPHFRVFVAQKLSVTPVWPVRVQFCLDKQFMLAGTSTPLRFGVRVQVSFVKLLNRSRLWKQYLVAMVTYQNCPRVKKWAGQRSSPCQYETFLKTFSELWGLFSFLPI